MTSFDWRRPRNVQMMTNDKRIITVSITPKEVVDNPNRISTEHLLMSIAAICSELTSLKEAEAERIDKLYSNLGGTHGREPTTTIAKPDTNNGEATTNQG